MVAPETPVYGFQLERRDQPPGHSLRVNDNFSPDTLGEQVETELIRIEDDIVEAKNEYTLHGWQDLVRGQPVTNGALFTFGAVTWDLLRVTVRTGALSGQGDVLIRINGDDTADLHQRGRVFRRMSDGNTVGATSPSGTAWFVGVVANSSIAEALLSIDNDQRVSMIGWAMKNATDLADRYISESMGTLSGNRTVDSIEVFLTDAAQPGSFRVWVEGHRRYPDD